MIYKFPKIDLSEPERIWLTAVYSKLKEGDQIDTKTLKAKLWHKLPRGFNPRTIDKRLLLNGRDITVLGIWHIDPESDFIEKTDQIILSIRDLLISKPQIIEVTAEQISLLTQIPKNEVARIFMRLSQLGYFHVSATTYVEEGKDIGYNSIRFDQESAFDEYLHLL